MKNTLAITTVRELVCSLMEDSLKSMTASSMLASVKITEQLLKLWLLPMTLLLYKVKVSTRESTVIKGEEVIRTIINKITINVTIKKRRK